MCRAFAMSPLVGAPPDHPAIQAGGYEIVGRTCLSCYHPALRDEWGMYRPPATRCPAPFRVQGRESLAGGVGGRVALDRRSGPRRPSAHGVQRPETPSLARAGGRGAPQYRPVVTRSWDAHASLATIQPLETSGHVPPTCHTLPSSIQGSGTRVPGRGCWGPGGPRPQVWAAQAQRV